MNTKWLGWSLINALGVFIYTSGVAWLLYNSQKLFGQMRGFWGPVAVLLLFVVSATVVGLLVLGRPAYLYFNNFKKAAFQMLFATLGWLALLTVITFLTQLR